MDSVLNVCAALVREGGRTLLCRRPEGRPHAGLWEFPGGKAMEGEDDAGCLRREMHEELGADVGVMDCVFEVEHEYPGKKVRIRFYRAFLRNSGSLHPREGQSFEWVETCRISGKSLLPADVPLARFLEEGAKFMGDSAKGHNKSGSGGVIPQ